MSQIRQRYRIWDKLFKSDFLAPWIRGISRGIIIESAYFSLDVNNFRRTVRALILIYKDEALFEMAWNFQGIMI